MICSPGDLVLDTTKKRPVLVLTAPNRHGDFVGFSATTVPLPESDVPIVAESLSQGAIQMSLDEVQARLPEIVHSLGDGGEVVIMEGHQTVARLLEPPLRQSRRRRPGSARGKLTVMVEDDEHLSE